MKITKILFFTLSLMAMFSFTTPVSVKSANQAMVTTFPMYFSTISSSDCSVLALKASWGFPATSILILDVNTGQVVYNGSGNNRSSIKFSVIAGHSYYVDVYNANDDSAGTGQPNCM